MHILGKYEIFVLFILFISDCEIQTFNFEYRIGVPKHSNSNKNGITKIRKLLAVDGYSRESSTTTLEEVKGDLIISELIIMTSPDKNRVRLEKQNLIDQLDHFMQGLCTTMYEKPQDMILELKTVILTVEKISKSNLDKYTHILFNDNTWKVNGRLKLGVCSTEHLEHTSQLCIGKAAFKNYLAKRGLVYMAKLYSATSDSAEIRSSVSCDSIIVLPINEKLIENKEAKCAIWENRWLQSHCKTINYTNTTIQCMCNNLEYYSLEYVPHIPSAISLTTEVLSIPFLITHISKINDVVISTVNDTSNNTTTFKFSNNQDEYLIVYYILIGVSLISIVVLVYAIKYLMSREKIAPADHTISYAPLFDEDMLNNIPIIK